ncbi:MAG: hypothetical protein P4L33_01705 [Capsulimonadaceae bacterium]|nr:hypothetical protein [Capsulimonadaceae bacterium]
MQFKNLTSPILFHGSATTAYRDPAAIYHDGRFHLFFTLVEAAPGDAPYLYTATSTSADLIDWTEPVRLTPADRRANFSSPGNVVRYGGEWVLSLQTYPRPNGEKYGNEDARVWKMRSRDLTTWSAPELLRVKGPNVPQAEMGRMIDPYLLEDKDEPGKWWCFFKQNGVSMSWSRDLENWTFFGSHGAGENACVVIDGDDYVLFHSPENGIGVSRSTDLTIWRPDETLMLGAPGWEWARGRITAGFVLDLRKDPDVGKFVMFFHGSGPENEESMFDNYASIGVAWSDDLRGWAWPGKE